MREWFYREMPEVLEGRRTEKGDMDMKKKNVFKESNKAKYLDFFDALICLTIFCLC